MLSGRKCLVVGSGISGVGAMTLLDKLGAEVFLFDEKLSLEELMQKVPEGVKATCYSKEFTEENMVREKIDMAVLSPGVPTDIPLVTKMREKAIRIIGEIELGYLAEQGEIIAITGTNGKTTTTTLVGEIMKAHLGEEKVFVVGNIGNPYTLETLRTGKDTVTVGEISSFQLETVNTFHPKVSAILNVTPDHLNRHYTMEAYAAAKEKIACNQTAEEICVLNYENEYTRAFGEKCSAKVVFFSSGHILENGYFLENDEICKATEGEVVKLLHVKKDMNLVGICNVENVMAAIAMTEAMGVPMQTILQTIKTFKAVEHRIEYVATKRGVDYYNDSKGTNPDAAIQGIKAMSKPTILIGGGYDKQNEYDEWIKAFDNKVKWLVLIGQTRDKIADCARKHGFEKIRMADSFEECLSICTQLAESGDAVLLSPACASWGMFPNYEIRGKIFKDYVNALKE